jgi:hypothetical protein
MIKNVFYQGKASGMTLQAFDKQAKVRAGCGGAAAVSVAGGVVAVFSAWLAYTNSVGAAQMFSQGQRTTKLIFSKSERGQKAFALDYCAAGFVTEGMCPETDASRLLGRATTHQPR